MDMEKFDSVQDGEDYLEQLKEELEGAKDDEDFCKVARLQGQIDGFSLCLFNWLRIEKALPQSVFAIVRHEAAEQLSVASSDFVAEQAEQLAQRVFIVLENRAAQKPRKRSTDYTTKRF